MSNFGGIERIKTNIVGFDELISGGIPKGYSMAVIGGPGTGKSIFVLQALMSMASDGRRVLFVSSEEPKEKVIQQSAVFRWDIASLEKNGRFSIYLPALLDVDDIEDEIKRIIKEKNIEVVGLDSLTMLLDRGYIMPSISKDILNDAKKKRSSYDESLPRKRIYGFVSELLSCGVTFLFTAEADLSGAGLSKDGITEYVSDGVIMLQHLPSAGAASRTLNVKKMRGTKIDDSIHPIEITPNGMIVKSQDDLYKA